MENNGIISRYGSTYSPAKFKKIRIKQVKSSVRRVNFAVNFFQDPMIFQAKPKTVSLSNQKTNFQNRSHNVCQIQSYQRTGRRTFYSGYSPSVKKLLKFNDQLKRQDHSVTFHKIKLYNLVQTRHISDERCIHSSKKYTL